MLLPARLREGYRPLGRHDDVTQVERKIMAGLFEVIKSVLQMIFKDIKNYLMLESTKPSKCSLITNASKLFSLPSALLHCPGAAVGLSP